MKNKILTTIIGSALLMLPMSSYAATSDGTLGVTSTGTADMTVTVDELMLITGMASLNFGTWTGSGDLTQNENVCIYTNQATGLYTVTASGSGAASAFTLTDGGNTLAYTVYFNDVSGIVGEVQLNTTVANNTQTGANTASQTCGGGNNANYRVNIASAALAAAPSGIYTGTLTIVVEPR